MNIQAELKYLELNERLRLFRDEAYVRGFGETGSPKEANWTKAFFDIHSHLPLAQRQAKSFAYALINEPVYIHPHSLIAGQIYQACPGAGCVEMGGGDQRWLEYSVYSTQAEIINRHKCRE
jgi:hypothetical protein